MALPRQNEIAKSSLLATIRQMNADGEKRPLKTSAKSAMVRREMVGHTIDLFNGLKYERIHITDEMVDRELGECLPKEITARLSFVSIPARKMRFVADVIKGMPIQKAMDILNFTKRVAAGHIAKTLKSAAANGMSVAGTAHIRPEDLYVKTVRVDEAPTAKRIRFQSMGRVFRYRKRYCHLIIELEERAAHKAAVAPTGTKAKKTDAADTTAKPKASTRTKSAKAPAKKAAVKKTAKKSATKKTK